MGSLLFKSNVLYYILLITQCKAMQCTGSYIFVSDKKLLENCSLLLSLTSVLYKTLGCI